MLPERMAKGQYLVKGNKIAHKIASVKKHPEYSEERTYVLLYKYGVRSDPMDTEELEDMGYEECLSKEELNNRFREGSFLPPSGRLFKHK